MKNEKNSRKMNIKERKMKKGLKMKKTTKKEKNQRKTIKKINWKPSKK